MQVTARFDGILRAFNSPDIIASIFCDDPRNACEDPGQERPIQYAFSQAGEVYTCPLFFTLQRFAPSLFEKDQISSMLHEFTHLAAIYSPPTIDHTYLHKTIVTLNTSRALQNADTYAFYAKAVCLASPACVDHI